LQIASSQQLNNRTKSRIQIRMSIKISSILRLWSLERSNIVPLRGENRSREISSGLNHRATASPWPEWPGLGRRQGGRGPSRVLVHWSSTASAFWLARKRKGQDGPRYADYFTGLRSPHRKFEKYVTGLTIFTEEHHKLEASYSFAFNRGITCRTHEQHDHTRHGDETNKALATRATTCTACLMPALFTTPRTCWFYSGSYCS